MARLPQPGGDNGNWGDILNDYLSQSHKSDGTIKDNTIGAAQLQNNSVTSAAIAPDSVTNAALADDSVNASIIADGTITEVLLGGAVQTKLNATSRLLGDLVNVREVGVVGDGATNDSAALAAAFALGKNLILPSGNYYLATSIAGPVSGVTVVGQSGTRIFSDTLTNLINLINCEDVTFENIIFETTVIDATNSASGGLVRSLSKTLKRVKFRSCTFRAINRATNGAKIIADGLAALAVDDILFDKCVFDRCGRMGIEIQDHTGDTDTTVRVRNIRTESCQFLSCGNVTSGIALSYSGKMLGCKTLHCHFDDSATIAIEYARDHQYAIVTGNTFTNLGSTCKLISMSNNANTSVNIAPTVTQNKSLDRSGFGSGFDFLNDARFSDNVFITVGITMDIRRSRRTRAQGELYDSTGSYALYLESATSPPCEKNTWDQSDFRTLSSTTSLSVVRFVGGACMANQLRNSRIVKGTSGTEVDQASGAFGNELWGCEINSSTHQPFSTITLTDADTTLAVRQGDASFIDFIGTLTATRTITFPRARRTYLIRNSTAQTLNLTAPTASSPVSVSAGTTVRFAMNDAALLAV